MKLVKDIKRRKREGRCIAFGCTCKALKRHLYCSKHKHQAYKEKHPHNYWYQSLKANAKRRGKVFTITLEQFKEFCEETGYLDKKGIKKDNYSIDREDDIKGYEYGNLQLLTNSQNTRKRFIDEKLRAKYGTTWEEPPIDTRDIFPTRPPATDEDPPF